MSMSHWSKWTAEILYTYRVFSGQSPEKWKINISLCLIKGWNKKGFLRSKKWLVFQIFLVLTQDLVLSSWLYASIVVFAFPLVVLSVIMSKPKGKKWVEISMWLRKKCNIFYEFLGFFKSGDFLTPDRDPSSLPFASIVAFVSPWALWALKINAIYKRVQVNLSNTTLNRPSLSQRSQIFMVKNGF